MGLVMTRTRAYDGKMARTKAWCAASELPLIFGCGAEASASIVPHFDMAVQAKSFFGTWSRWMWIRCRCLQAARRP